jgi:hypothetical protein
MQQSSSSGAPFGWNYRLQELQEFKDTYGDCLVPRRYEANPSLGNWVNKQRQLYNKLLKGYSTSMTQDRVDTLTDMGFVWDAKRVNTPRNSQKDKAWCKYFEELKAAMTEDGDSSLVKSNSTLGFWMTAQRSSRERLILSEERVNALESIGFQWTSKRERMWNERIQALLEYKDKHGDCIVPISYKNQKLAHWVSNQRKQYNLRVDGKPSPLTKARFEQLNSIGFVWNRWEYEFLEKRIEFKCMEDATR